MTLSPESTPAINGRQYVMHSLDTNIAGGKEVFSLKVPDDTDQTKI